MWRQRKELDTSIYTNVYKDTTNRLYGIWNLLLRWKCSVFKLIWHDLVVFLVLYFALSILYRYTNKVSEGLARHTLWHHLLQSWHACCKPAVSTQACPEGPGIHALWRHLLLPGLA